PKTKPAVVEDQSKYKKFTHNTHVGDMGLECNSCHKVPTANFDKVRSKDAAFPDVTDYPKHETCLDCHRDQFFKGKPPAICSNCHVNPSPNDSSRHPFQNPRELFDASPKGKNTSSAFEVAFPHETHVEIVSRNDNPIKQNTYGALYVRASARRAEESCAVCHQTYKPQGKSGDEYLTTPPKDLGENYWIKKGTFKSAPIGHTTCFTCHSEDSGMNPAPKDCGTCHKLKETLPPPDFDAKLVEKMGITDKILLDIWSSRFSAGKFRHEFESHADQSCSACHNVNSLKTNDFKTKKVSISSCNLCHITGTLADGGILNYEIDQRNKNAKFECVKCHISYGKSAIPASHLKAVEDAANGD
ncbi:MAG TPA: cytochrome c3 family protein, partial [Pyrinomonadaceae bacterium]|nr:cytochrome c3 family protein [Pyrinomonadaceae bacterium]